MELSRPTQEQVVAYKNEMAEKRKKAKEAKAKRKKHKEEPNLIVINGQQFSRQNYHTLISVAKQLGQRVPEIEEIIINSSYYAMQYLREVVKGPWPEYEAYLLKDDDINTLMLYRNFVSPGQRFPELEQKLLNNLNSEMRNGDSIYRAANACSGYCTTVLHGRWPEYEELLLLSKSVIHILSYANYTIHGRWLEAEPIIATDGNYAVDYAMSVIKDRWPACEDVIIKSTNLCERYAQFLRKLGKQVPFKIFRKVGECPNEVIGFISLSTEEFVDFDPASTDVVAVIGEGKKPYLADGENIYDLYGRFVKPTNASTTAKINEYAGRVKKNE